jgi:hypothetical protein
MMREKELRRCGKCSLCGKKLLESQLPAFCRITVESHAFILDAIRRQVGLEAMMGGSAALASVMGPDEEMTKEMFPAFSLTVCWDCYVRGELGTTAELIERFGGEASDGS